MENDLERIKAVLYKIAQGLEKSRSRDYYVYVYTCLLVLVLQILIKRDCYLSGSETAPEYLW